MTVNNIKRTINIMRILELIAKMKAWEPKYPPTKPGKGQIGGINSKTASIITWWGTQNYPTQIEA